MYIFDPLFFPVWLIAFAIGINNIEIVVMLSKGLPYSEKAIIAKSKAERNNAITFDVVPNSLACTTRYNKNNIIYT